MSRPKVRCRVCGATVRPLRVVYGYPTRETIEKAERGELKLGGCVIVEGLPDYVCPVCDAPIAVEAVR